MKSKEISEEVSYQNLQQIEKFADSLWRKFGIDIVFTRHFFNRLNDIRNEKPINTAELIRLFKKEYEIWGKQIAKLDSGEQGVLKDRGTALNVPFVMQKQKDHANLITKTIMRKNNFSTNSPTYQVENMEDKAKHIQEAFDQPYEWKKGAGSREVEYAWQMENKRVGKCIFRLEDPSSDAWGMLFTINGQKQITGEGNAFRIFATVVSCFKDWMATEGKNARIIGFAADMKEPSRIKLYNRLSRLMPRLGFEPFEEQFSTGNMQFYEFERVLEEQDLSETFNQPYPITGPSDNGAGNISYTFKSDVKGRPFEVDFLIMGREPRAYLTFHDHAGSHSVTNQGDAFRIFATVIECIKNFTASYPYVKKLQFSSETKEPSRVKLYNRMAAMMPRLGWEVDAGESNEDFQNYHFKRKGADITAKLEEMASGGCTSAGAVAPVSMPLGGMVRRPGTGSILAGINTSEKYPNTPDSYKEYAKKSKGKFKIAKP